MNSNPVHPVDEVLPAGRLTALGLQHVLVMYAGSVAVPLIIGRALKLSPEQIVMLIQADLFCCGLVTLIQAFGVTRQIGIRLPVMMGVTFAAVGPMVAMAGANLWLTMLSGWLNGVIAEMTPSSGVRNVWIRRALPFGEMSHA